MALTVETNMEAAGQQGDLDARARSRAVVSRGINSLMLISATVISLSSSLTAEEEKRRGEGKIKRLERNSRRVWRVMSSV